MKKRLPMIATLLALMACTGDPGKIPISMDLSQVTTADQIQRFLFVVKDPLEPSGVSLLFPKECTGCEVSESPCPSENVCVKINDCGFLVSEEGFDAKVDFSDFNNNQDIQLVACATNGVDTVLAAGSSTFKNSSGQQATVVLTESDTSCNILPQCP